MPSRPASDNKAAVQHGICRLDRRDEIVRLQGGRNQTVQDGHGGFPQPVRRGPPGPRQRAAVDPAYRSAECFAGLRVFLGPFPNVGGDWNQFLAYSGSALLRSTAPTYSGLEANFSLHAKLSTWGASLPESLANPSVSYGMIPGTFRGVNGGSEIVLECCDGFVGPLYIQQAFYPPSPFVVPPGGLSKLVALELHPFGDQVPYTPAAPIPEPASLLLFGSACAAAALRRRRGKTEGSQRASATRI